MSAPTKDAASDAALQPEHPEASTTPAANSHRRELLVQGSWALADLAIIVIAAYASAWMRYDLNLTDITFRATGLFSCYAAGIYLIAGVLVGPYRVKHLRGSFEETADLGKAALATLVVLLALALFIRWFDNVPRSLAVLTPLLGLIGMYTLRFVVRSFRWGRTAAPSDCQKVIIFGAGQGGRQLIRALHRATNTSYVPVAVLDDDPRKRRLKIDGLRVRGGRELLRTVVDRTDASALVIAMPSADAELVREIRTQAKALGLEVLVLPPTDELIGGTARQHDLRRLNLEDLLGRRRVQLDEAAIAHTITGKTVLVTGAGGSIGSELARQIARFNPGKLILLDRDESALHGVQMSLTGRALLDDGTLALANIRDLDSLREIFYRERPQLVFHTAALKHLTLLEQFPLEGWKTNVLGSLNVLQAASEVGVEIFVNISTDKAAHPSCVLGYTKRLAERLTADFAHRNPNSRFVSVRFGNVLGSRGSVVQAFTAQIERGGPITVTDPEVERYFMLIPEASQLVLQAAAIGHDGNVMVLEMGQPVKIVDLAKTLIDLSERKDIDIVFTGLRHGEKLSEELFYPGDQIQRSSHPLVNYVGVPSMQPARVLGVDFADAETAIHWMEAESATSGQPPSDRGQTGSGLVPPLPPRSENIR